MQRFNAIDAIAPAFARTHDLLFTPFRLGRAWKLAACFYVGFFGSLFTPFPLLFLLKPELFGADLRPLRAVLFVAVAIYFSFTLALFYLGARLSMVNVEALVMRQKFIAPMWRRYRQRVLPWIGLKVVVGTLLTLAMTPLILRDTQGLLAVALRMPHAALQQSPDLTMYQALLPQLLRFYGVVLLSYALLKLASTLLDDFVLPFFLLESISLSAAITRGFAVFVADPVQVLFYLLLKPILAATGLILWYVSYFVVLLLALLALLLVGGAGAAILFVVKRVTGSAGAGVSHLLIVAALIVLSAVLAAVLFLYSVGSLGYLISLLDAYALFFLGGRYPHLGSLLEAGPDGPFTPPPIFPSDDESEEDDGGPPMPMNPAVA